MAHGMDELREDEYEHKHGKAVFSNGHIVVRMQDHGGMLTFKVFKKDSLGEVYQDNIFWGDHRVKGYWHVKTEGVR